MSGVLLTLSIPLLQMKASSGEAMCLYKTQLKPLYTFTKIAEKMSEIFLHIKSQYVLPR